MFHATISPSPVYRAFPFIEWNAPVAISKPEQALLKSADENPLEYTLAEYEDAFAYARLLLKVLDQVTGPSNPGRVSELSLESTSSCAATGPGLEEEEALQYLEDDKTGVVTHYLISQLYEMMGVLIDRRGNSPVQISTLFYQDGKLLEDWRPLLRLLYRPGDPFSQRGAALCLMYILQAGCRDQTFKMSRKKIPMVEETLQSLISWLTSRLQSSHSMSLGVVTPTLVVLATCPPARVIFDNAGGIGYLVRHLRPKTASLTCGRRRKSISSSPTTGSHLRRPGGVTNGNGISHLDGLVSVLSGTTAGSPIRSKNKSSFSSSSSYSNVSVQQLYEMAFCLWAMTFECDENESVRNHFARDEAVAALADLIAAAPREKIVRLALSSLRHLAQIAPSFFVPEMIACRVLKSVNFLREQRHWTDPDVLEDLQVLHKILNASYQELTTWEVYEAELESGRLKWGIVHSEQFFLSNIRKMEGKNGDFCNVRRLIQLIVANSSSVTLEDEETLAIACFDLGEFVRLYPNGKAIAKRLGIKDVIMPLLSHESLEIQRHALQCISKLLINNWQAAIEINSSNR